MSSVRPDSSKASCGPAWTLAYTAPSHQDVGAVGEQITRILRLLSALKFPGILLFLEAIFFIQFQQGFGTLLSCNELLLFWLPLLPLASVCMPGLSWILSRFLEFPFHSVSGLHWNPTWSPMLLQMLVYRKWRFDQEENMARGYAGHENEMPTQQFLSWDQVLGTRTTLPSETQCCGPPTIPKCSVFICTLNKRYCLGHFCSTGNTKGRYLFLA